MREKYGSDCRIETVNCSHFGGDLARSELFGHRHGSFTGAAHEKEGWLKRAHNGILVLEEIGDLPRETQANLLTFLETGKFHKVGGAQTEYANVQIVGATNRENELRTDFCNRFFPFFVPPLHKRRQDILYYLAYHVPQLIPTLHPWEIMVLLAHNWPGNVREIERTGALLLGAKQPETTDTFLDAWEDSFESVDTEILALPAALENMQNIKFTKTGLGVIDDEDAPIEGHRAFQLYNQLQNVGIDADHLEELLNRFHIGLALHNEARPFSPFSPFNPENFHQAFTVYKRFDVALCPPVESFTNAYLGLRAFANLFWCPIRGDVNLLDVRNAPLDVPLYSVNRFFDLSPRNITLFNAITAYIRANKQNGLVPPKEPDMCDLKYDQLMKRYCQSLLERTQGNQAEAARRAGMNYSTFRLKLKKLDVI